MAFYRCYIIGDAGRFAGVEEIEAESDRAAIAEARRVVLGRSRKVAFEVWELGRQVYVENPLEAS